MKWTLSICAALVLAGCGPGPNAKADKDKKKDDKQALPTQTILTTSGSALVKSEPPKNKPLAERVPLWFVAWKSAVIDVTAGNPRNGSMTGVSGYLFDKGKKGSTFRSDEGVANSTKKLLTLTGNVRVVSPDPSGVLTCDRLFYDASKEVLHAQGHVRVVGKVGTVGTLSEILATKDLSRIATPDMFYSK